MDTQGKNYGVIVRAPETAQQAAQKHINALKAGIAVGKLMSGEAFEVVKSDYGAQMENFKLGKLDVTNILKSGRTHQSIVKWLKSTERMVELATLNVQGAPESIALEAIEAVEATQR